MYQDMIIEKIRTERAQHFSKHSENIADVVAAIALNRAEYKQQGWIFKNKACVIKNVMPDKPEHLRNFG